MKRLVHPVVVVFALLLAGYLVIGDTNRSENQVQQTEPSISSYEECIDEGHPALDSYPEQCETSDGKLFVRNLPENELSEVTSPITVNGTFICLPHWDTSGPQTMECAFGLLDDSGNYYTLRDPNPSQPTIGTTQTDKRVQVSGMFIPGSHERYQGIGTIEVEEITELNEL